jgi:6-phosphofructokinase
MPRKRIGILTGGGDVPGLNSVIKEVTYRSTENDCETIGIRRGWEGLTHVNLDEPASRERYITPLSRENTRTIDRTGGTFLHSSRTNPSKMKTIPEFLKNVEFPKSEMTKKGVTSTVFDMTKQVISNLQRLKLDTLIAIGGDDTLSYAAELDKAGFSVVPSPRPWTMTSATPNTVSASRQPSPVPPTPSTASAQPSDPTSASASSACSDATPAIRPCTPRT